MAPTEHIDGAEYLEVSRYSEVAQELIYIDSTSEILDVTFGPEELEFLHRSEEGAEFYRNSKQASFETRTEIIHKLTDVHIRERDSTNWRLSVGLFIGFLIAIFGIAAIAFLGAYSNLESSSTAIYGIVIALGILAGMGILPNILKYLELRKHDRE